MLKLISIISLFIAHGIIAQKLEGSVKDSNTQSPIPFATITIYAMDSSLINGVIADENGNYSLNSLTPGAYIQHVNFIGYSPFSDTLSISGLTIKNIFLSYEPINLDEVIVESERTSISQLIDRKVITIGDDIASTGGDARILLEQISEIQIDENGGVLLRNNSNVSILVNGKPSPLQVEELLRQLSASEIASIEVITTPSARHRANGLTGIINIITHQKVNKGLTFNTNSGITSLRGYNIGSTVGIGDSLLSHRLHASYQNFIYENNHYQERIGIFPYIQKGNYLFDGDVTFLTYRLDWFKTEKTEYFASIDYRLNEHEIDQPTSIIEIGTEINQTNISFHSHRTLDYSLGMVHRFSGNHKIEFDSRLSNNRNQLTSAFLPNLDITNNNLDNNVSIYDVAVDYTRQIFNQLNLEVGYLLNIQEFRNSLETKNLSLETIDLFYSDELTHAAYISSNLELTPLEVQVGLRIESYERNVKESSILDFSQVNLFPSIHLIRAFDTQRNQIFKIGYSRRISRPTLSHLNPLTSQSNEFLVRIGNPNLIMEFSNNIESSYQWNKKKVSITTTIFFNRKENLLTSIFDTQSDRRVIHTYENLGNSSVTGLNLSVNVDAGNKLKLNGGISWSSEKFHSVPSYLNQSAKNLNGRINNSYKLLSNLIGIVSWSYNGPRRYLTGSLEVYHKLDLGLKYSLFEDRIKAEVRLTDIYNNQRYRREIVGDGFTRISDWKPQSRMAFLNISYNFSRGTLIKRKDKKSYRSGVLD
ncbi:outer membrane beta-barrel family protein [Ekhidna sp.]|uniref:outer membrane beta-barrel family protein n=1 Tax=Ekhidna sp. TaxID=2608089 RepID=UPI003297860E